MAAVDLDSPRVLRPAALAAGANIEVIRVLREREVEMRVHERGSGLTLSCGTGAVAAAVAAAVWAGEWPTESAMPWTVHVPGGKLAVKPSAEASLLTGPAEIVASGELAERWLADPADRADLVDRADPADLAGPGDAADLADRTDRASAGLRAI